MNPFDERPPGPNFVGRESELAQLDEALESTAHNAAPGGCLVVGLHGTGKSSLLDECTRRCEKHNLIPVDCSARKATPYEQICILLESAVDQLDRSSRDRPLLADQWRGKGHEGKWREPYFQFHQSTFVNTAALKHDLELIVRRVQELNKAGLVFILDEAQDVSPEVFAEFRDIGRRFSNIAFLIAVRVTVAPAGTTQAGRDWLRRKIALPTADPGIERFFPTIVPLGPFDQNEAEDCITKRLQSTAPRVRFSDDLVNGICILSDMIPREVIRLSRIVFDSAVQSGRTNAGFSLLEPAYKHEYAESIAEIATILSGLGESQQRILRQFAMYTRPVTSEVVAQALFHHDDQSNGSHVEFEDAKRVVDAALRSMARSWDGIQVKDPSEFGIESGTRRAALRIALQMSAV